MCVFIKKKVKKKSLVSLTYINKSHMCGAPKVFFDNNSFLSLSCVSNTKSERQLPIRNTIKMLKVIFKKKNHTECDEKKLNAAWCCIWTHERSYSNAKNTKQMSTMTHHALVTTLQLINCCWMTRRVWSHARMRAGSSSRCTFVDFDNINWGVLQPKPSHLWSLIQWPLFLPSHRQFELFFCIILIIPCTESVTT